MDVSARCEGRVFRAGVWYFGVRVTRDGLEDLEEWICGPLHVKAVTRDGEGNNFGRHLSFKTTEGTWRDYSLPMALLAGDGKEMREELLSMGLEIAPQNRNRLAHYLQSASPRQFVRCATQVGWCGETFVLPDEAIGPDADGLVFQGEEQLGADYRRAGSLESWRDEVASLAPGNPILVLAISVAFAGPLIRRCNMESGGLHLFGDSSTGKTGAIEAACSVWGGPEHKRTWRATSNGMEGAAVLYNDGLLALDEISECDPREVGAIIYALGNGIGKQRASRSGAARAVRRWSVSVLSNGERTIETSMHEGGHRVKAGQVVRLLDICAMREHGAWDDLHGLPSGAAFTNRLKTSAKNHHGHAGRRFLERLVNDRRDLSEMLEGWLLKPEFASTTGQHQRAAARLALVGFAGELATEYGVTGWPQGTALQAAADALKGWCEARDSAPRERVEVLNQVADFINRHGDSRFSSRDGDRVAIRDRAGWYRDEGGRRLFMFTSDAMREAVKGQDLKRALDHLEECGALVDRSKDKRSKAHRIDGRVVQLYTIDPDMLSAVSGR